MADPADNLSPGDPRDLAGAVPLALRFEGGKRVHNADEYVAASAAEGVERAGLRRHGAAASRRWSSLSPFLGHNPSRTIHSQSGRDLKNVNKDKEQHQQSSG
jgi:hypothetical protein